MLQMEGVKSEVLELLHSRNISIKSTKPETEESFKIRRARNFVILTRGPANRNKSNFNLNETVKLETDNLLCRVCLKQGSISIHENDSSEDLAASINTIGGIDISIFDPYPKFLCQNCYNLLQSGISFRNSAQQSDNILKTSLRQKNIKHSYSSVDKINEITDIEKGPRKLPNTEPDSVQPYSTKSNENNAKQEIMLSYEKKLCQNEIDNSTLQVKLEPESSYLYDKEVVEDNLIDNNIPERTTIEITLERVKTEQESTQNMEIPVECTLEEQQETEENKIQNSEKPKNTPKIHYKKKCTVCGKKYGFRYAEGSNKLVCSNCFYKILPEPSTELNVMPEQEQTSRVKIPKKVNLINPKPDICISLPKVTKVVSLVKKSQHSDNETSSNSDASSINSDWEHEPIKPSKTPNKKVRQQRACKLCKVRFETTTEYDNHVVSDEHIKRKTYCAICDKSFAPEYFRRHKRTHKVEKSHTCETCGRSYMMPHELQRHRVTHTVKKADALPFKCSLCPYKGRFADSLKVHMRTHTGEKPYLCQECSQRFMTNSNLKKHMLVHKKPFRCQCDKRFCTRQQLELHFKSEHIGVKEHGCKICGKVYGYKHSLRKHERRVHKREKLRSGKLPIYLTTDETIVQEQEKSS